MAISLWGPSGGSGSSILTAHDDTLFGGATAHWVKTPTLTEAITGGAGRDISHGFPVYTKTPGGTLTLLSSGERQPATTSLNAALKPTGDMTLAGWFTLQEATANNLHLLMAHANSYTALGTWVLRYDTANEVTFGWGNNGNTFTGSVTSSGLAWAIGQTVHIAATRSLSNDTAKIYINGVLNNTTTGNSATISTASTQTCIGHSGTGTLYTTGIGSVVLYAGTALNDTQVATLYNSCLA